MKTIQKRMNLFQQKHRLESFGSNYLNSSTCSGTAILDFIHHYEGEFGIYFQYDENHVR